MVKSIKINRDEAELLVDVLEYNYETGEFYPAGIGVDLAVRIREKFGMGKQPKLKFMSIGIDEMEIYSNEPLCMGLSEDRIAKCDK